MQVLQQLAEIAGAVSVLATLLAHAPFVPARLAAIFARIGVASGRFAVSKRDVS